MVAPGQAAVKHVRAALEQAGFQADRVHVFRTGYAHRRIRPRQRA